MLEVIELVRDAHDWTSRSIVGGIIILAQRIAPLDHEILDNPVEDRSVVKTTFCTCDEIETMDGCLGRIEFNLNVSLGRHENGLHTLHALLEEVHPVVENSSDGLRTGELSLQILNFLLKLRCLLLQVLDLCLIGTGDTQRCDEQDPSNCVHSLAPT